MILPPPPAVAEWDGPFDAAARRALPAAARPVVLRALCADWPLVAAAHAGDRAVADYLASRWSGEPVTVLALPPQEGGRFFYNPDMTGFNFATGTGSLHAFLADLVRAAAMPDAPGLAVQSADVASLLPGLAADGGIAALADVPARIWIGNRIRVAAHYDAKDNLACCVAGRRRFTLFPPDQIGNLYPGPLELTPAGTPVSLVDAEAPDLTRFPRFAQAWASAQMAELAPGDALFIPYGWWHAVASLDPVSALVNYWWNDGAPEGAAPPYQALLAGLAALRPLPAPQRAVWQALFAHYCFADPDRAAEGIAPPRQGVLGKPTPALLARLRAMLAGR